jgi:hypothetical protein
MFHLLAGEQEQVGRRFWRGHLDFCEYAIICEKAFEAGHGQAFNDIAAFSV